MLYITKSYKILNQKIKNYYFNIININIKFLIFFIILKF